MIHIGKKRTIHTFFNILKSCKEHYSLETADGSNLAKLHRGKERQPPSLSNQARFARFTLKVAWSGISLIKRREIYHLFTILDTKGLGYIFALDNLSEEHIDKSIHTSVPQWSLWLEKALEHVVLRWCLLGVLLGSVSMSALSTLTSSSIRYR